MGSLNNNSGNSGNQRMNDKQKNYANSNERNRDNIRDNTRDHQYKEYDKTLTNDENYSLDSKEIKGNPDFRDTKANDNNDLSGTDDQK